MTGPHPGNVRDAGGPMRAGTARSREAFTLIELMVVIALMAGLVAFFFGGRTGMHQASALSSAQATVANLIVVARTRAVATGRSTRLLVHIDPRDWRRPGRFLRCLAVQTETETPGRWKTVTTVYLPPGIYVVPGNFTATPAPAGLFSDPAAPGWSRSDGAALRSTVLRDDAAHVTSEAIGETAAERWASVAFTETGTTAQSGDLVLTTGHPRSPGSFAEGEAPVALDHPQAARGVTLSVYGVPALIDDHESF
jgi:prepilin-type N-terminal cleavage/methylation domain-containing protein